MRRTLALLAVVMAAGLLTVPSVGLAAEVTRDGVARLRRWFRSASVCKGGRRPFVI